MAGMVDGRVAIVTGAGRGIGAGVAKMLAREGAKVVVNDFGGAVDGTGGDSGPAEEVVQEIKAAGGEAVANTADVSDFDQSEALVRQAIDTYGRLDVLVNVAGILRDRMIFNLSWEDWDAVIQVHMGGTFNTSRHAAAYWRELRNPDGHFRIINFTSGSGLHGAPGQPNYAAAKMGIVGLTYSCAHALQRYGVTSNAISPSAATRMGATVPVERRRARGSADERAPERRGPGGRLPLQRALGLVQRSDTPRSRLPDRALQRARGHPGDRLPATLGPQAGGAHDGGLQAAHPEQRDTARRHRASRVTGGTGSGPAERAAAAEDPSP